MKKYGDKLENPCQSVSICGFFLIHMKKAGFSLIEVIIGVALTALVMGALFMLYRSVTEAEFHMAEQGLRMQNEAELLQVLVDDFMQAGGNLVDTNCVLSLKQEKEGGSTHSLVNFCSFKQNRNELPVDWVTLNRLSYRVEEEKLLRLRKTIVGPEQKDEYVLGKKVADFIVEAKYQEEWLDHWPPNESTANKWPAAVRIKINYTDEKKEPFETQVLIPVGFDLTE